jgi:hypothetical protein
MAKQTVHPYMNTNRTQQQKGTKSIHTTSVKLWEIMLSEKALFPRDWLEYDSICF